MRVFRRVILPVVWVVIFATIAVSLAAMAFDSPPEPAGSGVVPTGKIPASNTIVERGTIQNRLELQGTIVVDPAVPAKASHDGVVDHFFVPVGAKVTEGDNLFQIKYEEVPAGDDGGQTAKKKSAPTPKIHYVNVVAPRDGKVASFAKELDDAVVKGDAVASIQQLSFRATGSISPIDQYRLLDLPESATVTISGGPAPFECDDLAVGGSAPASTSTEGIDPAEEPQFQGQGGGGAGEGGVAVSCRVPDKVRVFDGLSMGMVIDAGTAEDVLVVPVTAVRGMVDTGTVWIIDGGEPLEREVRLGVSDGSLVQVKKGLKAGENILEFVPGGDSAATESMG